MPPDDSIDAFRNRKDWNAHDMTKLRTAVIDWQISHKPIEEFVQSIAGQFPTRSVEAIKTKMQEIKNSPQSAVQSRLDEVAPARGPGASRFDEKYHWTEEESAKLKALLTKFDAGAGDTAQRWGKELTKEFPGRSAGSISQRILRLGFSGPRHPGSRAQKATPGKVDPYDILLGELHDLRSAITLLESRVEGMREHQNEPAALITQAIEALRQFDTKLALEILQQARRK